MAGRPLESEDFVAEPAKVYPSVKEETREGIARYLTLLTQKQQIVDQERVALTKELLAEHTGPALKKKRAETMAKLTCQRPDHAKG